MTGSEYDRDHDDQDETASGRYPGRALTVERPQDEPLEPEPEMEDEIGDGDGDGHRDGHRDGVEGGTAVETGAEPVVEAAPGPEAEIEDGTEETEAGPEVGRAPLDADMTGYLPAIQDPPTTRPDSGFDEPDVADTGFDGPEADVDGAAGRRADDDHLRRMQEIQLAFIDDPRKAALDAQNLLEGVLRALAADLYRQRDALQNPPLDGAPDTERMRLAVRRSRQLVETLTDV